MAKTHRFVPTKPREPQVITAEVVASRRVTPHMQRVTIGGDELSKFVPQGYDQWFRLFLPRAGQDVLALPTKTSTLWYAQYLLTPKERRPWVRNYTVREYRRTAAGSELDIDFVVHENEGHSGPAVEFALTAQPGEHVGILDQGLGYEPDRTEPWQLLVADETGIPAVLGILASAPAHTPIRAFIEIPSDADRQDTPARENLDVHWLARGEDSNATPGELALATVRASEFPEGIPYAYAVGEQALAAGVRRLLVGERSVPKTNVSFVGYWRQGRAASA